MAGPSVVTCVPTFVDDGGCEVVLTGEFGDAPCEPSRVWIRLKPTVTVATVDSDSEMVIFTSNFDLSHAQICRVRDDPGRGFL